MFYTYKLTFGFRKDFVEEKMYTITVNGQKQQTELSTVKAVLDQLQLTQGRYAVEINGELIPKSELSATPVEQDVVIEVVQAVGGG